MPERQVFQKAQSRFFRKDGTEFQVGAQTDHRQAHLAQGTGATGDLTRGF